MLTPTPRSRTEREKQREKRREGGWLTGWALLLLLWLPWVPIVLLRKQDSAGVSAVGYIYTHPAAQLLSSLQLQTAGGQDAFQRDHFLMAFILDFSGVISAIIFFWLKKKRKKEKKKSKQSWWAQVSGAKAKECISSNHKRRPLPSSLQPGLCLGNRRGPHNTKQGNLLIPGFLSRLLGGKIQSKKRREAFHRPQNLTRIEFWLARSISETLCNVVEFSEPHWS